MRGLSAIMILQHMMGQINDLHLQTSAPDNTLQPYEMFDLIGGTSTGGIIAVMLGRLRMTLEECEDAYLKLSKRIFTAKRSRWNKPMQALDFLEADGKFDAEILELAIREVIKAKEGSDEGLLKHDESSCKVYVIGHQS